MVMRKGGRVEGGILRKGKNQGKRRAGKEEEKEGTHRWNRNDNQ